MSGRTVTVERKAMRFDAPLRIANRVFEAMPAIEVTIAEGPYRGRGEAAGVFYTGDDVDHMVAEIATVRTAVEAGADRQALRSLLPSGGARNALDCALWELESLAAGRSVADLAGVEPTSAKVTTFTLSADTPDMLLRRIEAFTNVRSIKLKLDGDIDADAARVMAVRGARPDAWLGVDANQGYSPESFNRLAPVLVDCDVQLVEQPLPRGSEAMMGELIGGIAFAADESVLDLRELETHADAFDAFNIKLDKCGGLTEALMMVARIRDLGKRPMVGNMAGSSLATAPAFVVAHSCDLIDLDGAILYPEDPLYQSLFATGKVDIPDGFWGHGDIRIAA